MVLPWKSPLSRHQNCVFWHYRVKFTTSDTTLAAQLFSLVAQFFRYHLPSHFHIRDGFKTLFSNKRIKILLSDHDVKLCIMCFTQRSCIPSSTRVVHSMKVL